MRFSVFTKPWKTLTATELAKKVADWGFDGVEFPLRDGYQAEPKNAVEDLPKLAKTFGEYGVSIMSVASSTDEAVFEACQKAGVPIIRIMAPMDKPEGYLYSEAQFKKYLDSLVPLCEKYGVQVGVQNHYGRQVFNTMQLRHLVEDYDPKHIGAVWDAAHSGLTGEEPDHALDIIWDKLILVNLKSAYWVRKNGPESANVLWKPYFTTGVQGMTSYPDIIDYLKKRCYTGDICLPAEYTAEELVDELTPKELAYVKSLVG
ncbi:MAG: sugar phosphate isomerase/epimerase [Provencibacterium sp.]|jgi:sugar phosphate isomerase/epimerase|nr:sugar phosphate isomerase/epimerase [Provencibacterium sp.]